VINFVLCDDKVRFIKDIKDIIIKVMMSSEIEFKIHEFTKYNQKLDNLINKENEIKIYILDIEMPGLSGIDIARKIREKDWNSIILFLTVHEEQQNDIFKSRLMVLDFINKNNLYQERLENSIKTSLSILKFDNRFLTFKFKNAIYRVKYNEILYIEKELGGKRCVIHTKNGKKYHVISTLQQLADKLGPSFYRCHRACLVNVENIISIDITKNIIYLIGGKKLNLISRDYKKEFMEYVSNY